MFTKISYPTDAVLAITYKCNSRCTMCDIWKITEHFDIEPRNYLRLPNTLRTINISGGEPFLNPGIVEIIKNVKTACQRAKIIISSNGFMTDFILEKMKEILKIDPNIGVAISIDGIGETQEKVRGIPQGFEKCMKTINGLRALGVKNLRIAFTLSNENVIDFKKVYDLARIMRVEFTCAVAQNSTFYFGGKTNNSISATDRVRSQFDAIIASELKSFSPKRWARAYFTYGLKNFALQGDPILPSDREFKHFFMDPGGNIYPSVVHDKIMGNITKNSFDEIWHSVSADTARDYVNSGEKKAWMICTARTSIKKHPLLAFLWLIETWAKMLFHS